MIIPVLITPFTKSLDPDYDSLISLVQNLKKSGASKFWLFGTGGEDFSLTFNDRVNILTCLANSSFDLNAFYVGVGNLHYPESFSLTKKACDLGFRNIHFIQQSRVKSIYSVFSQLKEISKISSSINIYGYFSDNYSRKLDSSAFRSSEIIDICHKNLSGIKFSTSSIFDLELIYKMFEGTDFKIIPAKAKQLIKSLEIGYKSSTTIEACLHLRLLTQIVDLYNKKDFKNASLYHDKFVQNADELKTSASKHNFMNIAEIKYILYKKGVIASPHARMDLVPLDATDMASLDSKLHLISSSS